MLTEKANNIIRSIVENAYKNTVSDELAHRFEDIVVFHPEAVDRNLKKRYIFMEMNYQILLDSNTKM